jgi:Zn finger protein HypA/HybF involved in hydrogenase expression
MRIILTNEQKEIYENLKLKMELVPRSCWWSNVRDNVDKDLWDVIRKKTYQKTNFKCEICGGQGNSHPVECHEVWRYENTTKKQILEKFISLCPTCHSVKHMGYTSLQSKTLLIKAMNKFLTINNLSKPDARVLYDYAFQEWMERSGKKWNLDISLLMEEYNIELKSLNLKPKERTKLNK